MVDRRARYQTLMAEYSAVWKEREAALGVVVEKQGAIATGRSREPPTPDELERLDRAETALDHVLKRIKPYAYRHRRHGVTHAGRRRLAATSSPPSNQAER